MRLGRGRPLPAAPWGRGERWASVGGGWWPLWPAQLQDNIHPHALKCLVCRFGICSARRHQSQGDSLGVGWGFGAAGCQINGLCHHCPLLGKGSDSRMKSDSTRKVKAMSTLTRAPACRVLAALVLLALAPLCFTAAHLGAVWPQRGLQKRGRGQSQTWRARALATLAAGQHRAQL